MPDSFKTLGILCEIGIDPCPNIRGQCKFAMQAERQRQTLLVGYSKQVSPFSSVQITQVFEPRTVESKGLQQYPVELHLRNQTSTRIETFEAHLWRRSCRRTD